MDQSRDTGPFDRPPPVALPLPGSVDDGVDDTLIRWMLAMTPEERLRTLENTIRSILRLRDARNPT